MVTNEDKEVATSASPFMAATLGPTDTHISTTTGPPASFCNSAKLSTLQPGSSLTFIGGARVFRAKLDALVVSDAEHPTHKPGVSSHNYRGPAKAETHSRDVVVEGGLVVRNKDVMSMNTGGCGGNTDGILKLAAQPVDLNAAWEQLRLHCCCDKYSLPDDQKKQSDDSAAHHKKEPHYQAYFNMLHPYLNKMAQDMKLKDARFLFTLTARESGWLGCHAICLNNPFGLTKGGKDNIRFSSVQSAADYWQKKYGEHVKGAQTMDEFSKGLKAANYNTSDAYYKWPEQQSVNSRIDRFGYTTQEVNGVTILVPKPNPKPGP